MVGGRDHWCCSHAGVLVAEPINPWCGPMRSNSALLTDADVRPHQASAPIQREEMMERPQPNAARGTLREIAFAFLKLGTTAYGGPAIMGIMQSELQEKRQWVSKQRFVQGLSLVNMLPGAAATQLGIFLGYSRGGWWG